MYPWPDPLTPLLLTGYDTVRALGVARVAGREEAAGARGDAIDEDGVRFGVTARKRFWVNGRSRHSVGTDEVRLLVTSRIICVTYILIYGYMQKK